MGRRSNNNTNRFTPEFWDWLKLKKVSAKRVQRNPETLDQYYQEWAKTRAKPKRQSLFKLPAINLDLDTIANGLRIATKVLRTFQGTNEFTHPSKMNRIDSE